MQRRQSDQTGRTEQIARPEGVELSAASSSTYLSSREVAALLHVSPATVSRWARASRLPYVRTLGGHRRYPPEPLLRLAQQLGLHAPTTSERVRQS